MADAQTPNKGGGGGKRRNRKSKGGQSPRQTDQPEANVVAKSPEPAVVNPAEAMGVQPIDNKQRERKTSEETKQGQKGQDGQGQKGQGQQGSAKKGQGQQGQGQKGQGQQGQGQKGQGQKGQGQQGQGQKGQGQQGQGQKGQGQQGQDQKGQGQQGQGQKGQGQQGQGQQDQKGPPGPDDNKTEGEVKSKAQLRAERRAKQEAQRAAKAAAGGAGGKKEASIASKEVPRVPDNMRADDERTRKRIEKRLERQHVPSRVSAHRKVGLFSHLHQYERETSLTSGVQFSSPGLHPAILKLGLQYAEGLICGSNARCVALLGALKQVIRDYSTPPDKELARDLDAKLKPYITFLDQCRPKSVSMGNAIKYIKWHINHIPQDMSDTEAKKELNDAINTYLYEKIQLAGEAVSKTYASTKIRDGDVIMVYACSSLIQKVLQDAHDVGKRFRVVVVDGRPKLEGREMLRRLVKYGIRCTYVLINAASHIFPQVTKVLLGAHALLANGYVMSRVGSSQMALLAKAYNVPVLVCCETYKFCERVQTDSFVFNELGDPQDVAEVEKEPGVLSDWKTHPTLSVLNLVYDVTPPELVTMVITEVGMVPCTSVPVVLRVKHVEGDSFRD